MLSTTEKGGRFCPLLGRAADSKAVVVVRQVEALELEDIVRVAAEIGGMRKVREGAPLHKRQRGSGPHNPFTRPRLRSKSRRRRRRAGRRSRGWRGTGCWGCSRRGSSTKWAARSSSATRPSSYTPACSRSVLPHAVSPPHISSVFERAIRKAGWSKEPAPKTVILLEDI
jgi:hypothetical protein